MPRSALFRLSAACAALVLLGGIGEVFAQEKVGVSSAVNPNATGTPPGAAARKLVIGQDVVFNERIATEAEGQTQLLFVDESSMTVGPNSDLTIDQFVYDPKSGGGKLAMSATKGLLRFVGGKLSKQDEAVTLRTNSATLAIRGGAFIANIGGDGRLTAIFIYGRGLTITGVNGVSQTVQRPGFEITVAGRGAAPSAPTPTPPGELDQLLAQLDGRSGATGRGTDCPDRADSRVERRQSDDLWRFQRQRAAGDGAASDRDGAHGQPRNGADEHYGAEHNIALAQLRPPGKLQRPGDAGCHDGLWAAGRRQQQRCAQQQQ